MDVRISPVLLVLLGLFSVVTPHLRLTYPQARYIDIDFLDNARTRPPCGVPAYPGKDKITKLYSGMQFNVTWHLSYAHRGGYQLQLLEGSKIVHWLTPANQWLGKKDVTAQGHLVTIPPDYTCDQCTLRLLRQASEWGGAYRFWSCAEVTIDKNASGEPDCSGQTVENGQCECEHLYSGPNCQYKDECMFDGDCNGHGKCIDIDATSYPKKQCFCKQGWFGENCQHESPVKNIPDKNERKDLYKTKQLTDVYNMYYRIVGDELEVILEATSTSWMGIGWRPQSVGDSCKAFPNLNVERGPDGKPEPNGEPETKPEHPSGEPETKPEHPSGEPETKPEHPSGEPETKPEHPSGEPETKPEHPSGEPETKPEHPSGEPETKPEHPSGEPETKPEHPSGEPETKPEHPSGEPETKPEYPSGEPETEDPSGESEAKAENPSGEPETKPEHPSGEPETKAEKGSPEPEKAGPEPSGEPHPSGEPEPEKSGTAEPELGQPEGTGEPEPNNKGEPGSPEPEKKHPKEEPTSEVEPEVEPEAEGEPEPEGEPAGEGEPEPGKSGVKHNLHAMDCTDIVIGAARMGNLSRIQDYYTRDRSTPRPDAIYGGSQSLTAAVGEEKDGMTTLLFRRKLQRKAEELSDYDIEDDMMHLIFARGQEPGKYIHYPNSGLEAKESKDPNFYRLDELKYHGHGSQRGSDNVNFFEKADSGPNNPCTNTFVWPAGCMGKDCVYHASWQYNEDDSFTFNIRAKQPQNQWTGIGFGTSRSMTDVDVILGYLNEDGDQIMDGYIGSQYTPPSKDASQDLTSQSLAYINGQYEFTFTRKRDTGDASNDHAFSDTQCYYFIFPVGGGRTNTRGIMQHSQTPIRSDEKICIRQCQGKPDGEGEPEPEKGTVTPSTVSVYASLRLMKPFIEDYKNVNSAQSKDLIKMFLPQLLRELKQAVPEVQNMIVTSLRPGSVVAEVQIDLQTDGTQQHAAQSTQNVEKELRSEISDGQVGTVEVDPGTVKVSRTKHQEPSTKRQLMTLEIILICVICAIVFVALIVLMVKCLEASRKGEERQSQGKVSPSPPPSKNGKY